MADEEEPNESRAGDAGDDDAWLAALAGRSSKRATSPSTREGAMLRTAMRAWSPAVAEVAAHDPARIAALIVRAREAGLLDDRGPAAEPVPRWSDRLRVWWGAGAALGARPAFAMVALVLVFSGIALVMRPDGGPGEGPDVERAAPDAVTLLRADDPEGLRRAIVAALAARGVEATPYARFDRYGLDADLPQPLDDATRAVLDRFRLPVPVDGVLRVEVEGPRR